MSSKSVESGYSRLSDLTISCFRLLPRGPSPRRPFVLRSPPPSRGGRTAARASPRSRAPSSFAPTGGRRGRRPSLSVPLHPVPYLRAVAHAMLEGEGFVVPLAAEIGFDDAKLELLGVAVVLPRPVYGPDAALVDPLPPKLHGRLRKAELVLQHGDGRAVGVPVRKALFELGRVILAQQIKPPNAEDPYRRGRTLSVQL